MPAAEADQCVERAVRDFRVQGGELKGKNLTKTPAGRKAIARILNECLPHSNCIVFDKTFALCCKLFEYIFEPVIADKSSLFYGIGFHRFVANWLYVELITTGESLANDLLLDFEKMMRRQDSAGLKKLFGVSGLSGEADRISAQILEFAMAHREAVLGELEAVRSVGAVGNWVLDLSDTAVTSLLCHWGEKFYKLWIPRDETPFKAWVAGSKSCAPTRFRSYAASRNSLRAASTSNARFATSAKVFDSTFAMIRDRPRFSSSRIDSGLSLSNNLLRLLMSPTPRSNRITFLEVPVKKKTISDESGAVSSGSPSPCSKCVDQQDRRIRQLRADNNQP
jgi:hypothetical protein